MQSPEFRSQQCRTLVRARLHGHYMLCVNQQSAQHTALKRLMNFTLAVLYLNERNRSSRTASTQVAVSLIPLLPFDILLLQGIVQKLY